MTCVILTGGIDLSVGSVLALSTALCAGFITNGVPVGLAMVLALIIGTALGAVSGLLVTKGRLQPFIATLITFVVMFLIFMFVLEKTTFGRRVYATGSNEQSAKLAGINVNRTKLITYAISGCMSALSGLILLSRLSSAQPTLGSGYELDAIAAVALGGTSMNGGRGRVWGTFVGILIIAVLNNGLNILGVSSYYQDVVKGIVILIAVLSDRNR